ncbi:hypothetical protein [Neobacillus sp. LXY-1]
MGTTKIDIDKLLEATTDLTAEKNNYFMTLEEIDRLLDHTKEW